MQRYPLYLLRATPSIYSSAPSCKRKAEALQRRLKVGKGTIQWKLRQSRQAVGDRHNGDSECKATFVIEQVNVSDDDPSPNNKTTSKNLVVGHMASEIKIVA